MSKPGRRGITRIYYAAKYSAKGIKTTWQNEAAFRQECTLAFFLIPLAVFWGDTGVEKALLISSVLFVLVVELLNSAVEMVVDRIGSEHHELSGYAKDMGSAAVMLSLCMVGVVWAAVFWDHLQVW